MILWPHVCCTRTRTGAVDMLPPQTLSPTAALYCSTDMSSEMKAMVELMIQVHVVGNIRGSRDVAVGVLIMTVQYHHRSARDPKPTWLCLRQGQMATA
jgi:hypothetical protein